MIVDDRSFWGVIGQQEGAATVQRQEEIDLPPPELAYR